jgi:REP element-mobilizing transposase RayT
MPRFARFHVTGGLFHVISRFHDRRFYLDIEGAREKYLELLGKALDAHDSRLVAYCLMSSHVHLVVQLGNDRLGKLTKRIHAPFGNWVNARRKGLGTVLADRPKSVLVHTETYGMELIRYVHNNPVRAGLVERASESGWSSQRAYLGLEACPPWLATEAVFGPDEKEHESIRHELALYVDEGRTEGRRPEFSGEVSLEFARRVRKLMGGDVELSYPVLGPDAFVVSALKEQVHRHNSRQLGQTRELGVERIIELVFVALGFDPQLARKRIKPGNVARARALVSWLWVEKMGRPQVVAAEGLGVRPTTVTKMLTKLRRSGLSKEEERILDEVLGSLMDGDVDSGGSVNAPTEDTQPKVIVLKRQRK